MKKLMLCVVLMVISFTLNAATISISNPTVTAAGLFSPTVTNTHLSSTLRMDHFRSGYLLGGPVSVAWDLEAAQDSRFSLGVFGSGTYGMHGSLLKGPWTVSILDSEGAVLKSGKLGSVFDALLLKAGDSITAVVSGSIRLIGSKSFSTTLFLSNIEVSEVPLPAAVWLFGSVLLGGLALRRRKAQPMPIAI
ncbi:hypothetical protein LH51_17685 [Nitrincola sp. A-D6]|uniref:hypothetical protein n=1 Tax=Nitrincola sp. A-D6 TaxID=1545442 RepID=UPI00051F9A09|nr:hypothetical protein [Nitrincola sp. A-D6]KGK41040.1 hypothetical protein LH51_17685 [Nitrincola sp. A-D6]